MNTPASVSDKGRTQKTIAADLLCGLIPMAEAQPAFLRSQTLWETRIILHTFRSRLKNTFRRVLENASVFLLGAAKSLDGLFVSLDLIDLRLPH
jgi:hypothetical protein